MRIGGRVIVNYFVVTYIMMSVVMMFEMYLRNCMMMFGNMILIVFVLWLKWLMMWLFGVVLKKFMGIFIIRESKFSCIYRYAR